MVEISHKWLFLFRGLHPRYIFCLALLVLGVFFPYFPLKVLDLCRGLWSASLFVQALSFVSHPLQTEAVSYWMLADVLKIALCLGAQLLLWIWIFALFLYQKAFLVIVHIARQKWLFKIHFFPHLVMRINWNHFSSTKPRR